MVDHDNMPKICENMSNTSIGQGTKRPDLLFSRISDETKRIPRETIPVKMMQVVQNHENFPALRYKSDPKGDFDQTLTLKDYLRDVKTAASNFIKVGLQPKASIGIIGFNHPAWFISNLGAIFAGGFACGIYTTNSADICKFIMNDCNCQIAVVENDDQLLKVQSILPDVPHLKAIIKYTGTVSEELKQKHKIAIYTWEEFMKIESGDARAEMEKRLTNIKSEDCAILIYTSGTTGLPKGVMLSHDNVIFTMQMVCKDVGIEPYKHSIISYLPLSHIAANIMDILTSSVLGATVYFAEPDALKGSLGKTLKEVRPTIFITVPRVFEKFQEQIELMGVKINTENKIVPAPKELQTKIKLALGLDRCEYIGSAAAPITLKTLEFFQSLDIIVNQIYGMSECSGPQTIGPRNNFKIGSAGSLMSGVELKIADPDENQVGEICMRGRHVFLGYFNAPGKTKEVMDADGWLHSGDLGKIEHGDSLFITGRIKELIVTAGGENVAPVPIEDRIKSELPFVSNTMLVGDHKKFLSCLLTLKTLINPETQLPTDDLSPLAIAEFSKLGIQATKVQQILESKNPTLLKIIDDALKRVNSMAVSRAAYVQKWAILPKDFSIGGGELGPTLKLKRMVITESYGKLIDSLYGP